MAGNYTPKKQRKYLRQAMPISLHSAVRLSPTLTCRTTLRISYPAEVSDPGTLFGGTVVGYTDYPQYRATRQ